MIPERVQKILDEHGLSPLVFNEGTTPTVETAARAIGVQEGQIAKSILMRGKDGEYRIFVIAGDKKISSSRIKQLTGIKHSMASGDETRKITGFSPGGVCPFGVSGIQVYIDGSIKAYEEVYPAAGDDASGVPVSYERLLEITGGIPCDITQ